MRRVLFLPLLAALAGCLNLAKDYPERHLHALAAARTGDAGTPAPGTVLAIRTFGIASRYAGNEFVYRKSGTEWEADYYNAFFVPPREMLTDEARGWISSAGLFGNVVNLGTASRTTHILEGHVAHLYCDASGSSPKAILEIQFLLLDDRVSPPSVAFSRTYAESVPMAKDDPEALVTAWNEGLKRILASMETDLRGAAK